MLACVRLPFQAACPSELGLPSCSWIVNWTKTNNLTQTLQSSSTTLPTAMHYASQDAEEVIRHRACPTDNSQEARKIHAQTHQDVSCRTMPRANTDDGFFVRECTKKKDPDLSVTWCPGGSCWECYCNEDVY